MTLDDIKVGDFVVYVLGGGPRMAEVKDLRLKATHPQVGLKPWLPGYRKPDYVGTYAVIFSGPESAARSALARYEAVHRDRAREVKRARRRYDNAQHTMNELNTAVERQAREAAARVPA